MDTLAAGLFGIKDILCTYELWRPSKQGCQVAILGSVVFSNLSVTVLLSIKNKGLFIYIMYRINDAFIKQSICFNT